jgi:hypothetical protein
MTHAQDYLRESGVPFALLRTCMFFENAINFTSYQKGSDGSYVYGDNLGTAPHGWHAVADIGHSAAGEQLSQPTACCNGLCERVCKTRLSVD